MFVMCSVLPLAKRLSLYALLVVLCVAAKSQASDDIAKFERMLDLTIRSACHGYMIDAIPDFFSETREWLNQNTPFCQTVRTLANDESAVELFKQESQKNTGKSFELNTDPNFKSRMAEYYAKQQNIDIECQDWMCQHVRIKAWDKGNPISMADYNKVVAHCDGSYGCIEGWFKRWPRPLPNQTVQLSLDSLLDAQESSSQPTTSTTPATTNTDSSFSLDSLMGAEPEVIATPNPTSSSTTSSSENSSISNTGSELSLDNVFAARDQLSLDKSLQNLQKLNNRLQRSCQCSLTNSGCFTIPSNDILDSANAIEGERYKVCTDWKQRSAKKPTTQEEADLLAKQANSNLQKIRNFNSHIDKQIANWRAEQRRLQAQHQRQQQEQADRAYAAGMMSILAQSGAVANGSLSAEQAARNAANSSKRIENSGSRWQPQKEQNIKTSVPNFNGDFDDSGETQASNNDNFACYDPRNRICIHYRIYNSSKAKQMKNQCSRGNNRLLASCEKSGPSCSMSSSIGRQTTFSYDSSSSQVRQACLSHGGIFKAY